MVSTSDTLLLLAAQFRNGEITKGKLAFAWPFSFIIEELLKALEKATSNVQGLGSSASQLPSSSAPAQTTDGLTPVSPSLPTLAKYNRMSYNSVTFMVVVIGIIVNLFVNTKWQHLSFVASCHRESDRRSCPNWCNREKKVGWQLDPFWKRFSMR